MLIVGIVMCIYWCLTTKIEGKEAKDPEAADKNATQSNNVNVSNGCCVNVSLFNVVGVGVGFSL